MFRKFFRIIGITLGCLVTILIIAYGAIYLRVSSRINKKYDVKAETIEVNYDSASLVSGERLVAIRACRECHGKDLSGSVLVDDAMIGTFVVKNITKGSGGLRPDFSVEDWVLALKHGLRRDGTPLRLMPSHEFSLMSEKDMADIIAYASRTPPVDRVLPEFKIGPLAYVLTAFDLIPLLPAEQTDHTKPLVHEVKVEPTEAYGKYLAAMCINCHGSNYKGGKSPVPGGKDRPDITSTGNPGKWTVDQFMHTLRTGETPEGKKLNPEDMPWTITKSYNDVELTALRLYLTSLP